MQRDNSFVLPCKASAAGVPTAGGTKWTINSDPAPVLGLFSSASESGAVAAVVSTIEGLRLCFMS